MTPIELGASILACTSGGALLGQWLRTRLPEHHLSGDSKDAIKSGVGLVATMTALLLGLIVASAHGTFRQVDASLRQSATELLTLDRTLARYGPETRDIRGALHQSLVRRLELTWPKQSSTPVVLDVLQVAKGSEDLFDQIRSLPSDTEDRKWLKTQAMILGESVLKGRWTIFMSVSPSIPIPFLVLLMFWLSITFTSFGLQAPRNPTAIAALLLSAVSVAGSIFLAVEMENAFEGLIKVSSGPLEFALERMNK